MKKYIIIGAICAVVLVALAAVLNDYRNTKQELIYANQNVLAYSEENSLLKDKNYEFQFTVNQLNYLNDSLIQKMNDVRNELGIKDKQIKALQYQLSVAKKNDTIVINDTIFKDKSVDIDTTLNDDWYKLNLKLKYPSTIITSVQFTSEKYVVISSKKEYVEPRKKCFVARWFQKKQDVVTVDIVEKNPYIENKQSRFIEIIK